MIIIPPPTSSYDVKPRISIRGVTYRFTYRWNSRSERWKLDIEDLDNNILINGLTIVEKTDITSHLLSAGLTWEGFLMASPNKITSEPLGRDNFGPDKGYELLYIGYIEI